MGKFWKKNKAAVIGVLVAILATTGVVGLGYYYSRSEVGYDYIGIGPQIPNINYNTGTGNVYQVGGLLTEGLITPSTDFGSLQALVNEELVDKGTENSITDNNVTSVQEYKVASIKVLIEMAKDLGGSTYEGLNENEKAISILASDDSDKFSYLETLDGEELLIKTEQEAKNLDRAAQILTHSRPITYVGDDALENIDTPEWDPKATESGNVFTAYEWGVSDLIYTNKTFDYFRFRMRDGSLDDGVSTWQSWGAGHEDDRVSAADVAFATSRQAPGMYGSSGRYMYTSISKLIGVKEYVEKDAAISQQDKSRFDNDRTNGHLDKEASNEASKAMYYGMVNDETAVKAFNEDKSFVEFGDTPRESGVIFHDPLGYENKSIENKIQPDGTETGVDYSYVDFTVEQGNTKFPTMLSSTGFWPIDWEWFVRSIGDPGVSEINTFGTSADTFLSNGAQKVTKFDSLFGYTTEKNENYFDSNIVSVNKSLYRMMSEPSTQVAKFSNGEATYIIGGSSNTKLIQNDEISKSWIKDKLTKPSIKYMFFNMGTDRLKWEDTAHNAKYTSDPNFRRAITYLFDANAFHEYQSLNTVNAVSSWEPLGMYQDSNGTDFVDYLKATSFKNQGHADSSTPESEQMEYFGEKERRDAVSNPIDFSDPNLKDPTRSVELSKYYFNVFMEDMHELGVSVDDVIDLTFLTSAGANDPYVKTMQQVLEGVEYDDPYSSRKIKVKVTPRTVPSTQFFPNYYEGHYDLANIQWGADYLDPWSNIGTLNYSELSRGNNATANWNFWDGSDLTFDDSVYGKDKTLLAKELFNDGLAQLYDGGKNGSNITEVTFDNSEISNAVIKDDSVFQSTAKLLWDAVLSDNGITSYTIGTDLANTNTEKNKTFGLDYYAHTSDIWSIPDVSMAANIILELLLKDSATVIIGTTESGSISPSRGILEGDPVIGYETRKISFDVTRTRGGFWHDVNDKLQKEFVNGKK